MNEPISWPELFRHVDKEGGIVERLGELQHQISDLTFKLANKQSVLAELSSSVQIRLKGAIEVANLLGVEVPPEAKELLDSLSPSPTKTPTGTYTWKPNGRVAFRAGISRAMWRLSHGCGGSSGREGVLTSGEFRKLLGKKNLTKLAAGEQISLSLPNGQQVAVSRAKRLEVRDA